MAAVRRIGRPEAGSREIIANRAVVDRGLDPLREFAALYEPRDGAGRHDWICPRGTTIIAGSGSYRHSETEQKNCRAREESHESHVDFGKGVVLSSAAICLLLRAISRERQSERPRTRARQRHLPGV